VLQKEQLQEKISDFMSVVLKIRQVKS
jgi:hypothetical protein